MSTRIGLYTLPIATVLYRVDMIEGLRFGFLVTLAIAAHTVSPNKYVGYFVFRCFFSRQCLCMASAKVDTLLVRFGRLPSYTYSDLFGYAPLHQRARWVCDLLGFSQP